MTHSRLLDIAVREFGSKGLEGASTREIASAAGTAMSAITYHYGGKEGLYLAAADHIASQMALDMPLEAFEAIDGTEPSPVEARRQLHLILDHFIDKMANGQHTHSLFIMREQSNPTEAFERIWGGLMGNMMERLAALVCIASGCRDIAAAHVATITMLGQVIVLRSARASCLKLLRKPDYDDAAIAAIKVRIGANIDATIDTLTAERQEPQ
ncbi:MAG: CerR family C-terminal domain-containing protein [Pseudomonadota bacterium]|nr:CerR family C-terminal domain-containing protein [Pseudomonadota bacterium]